MDDAFDLLRVMRLETTKGISNWTITQDMYLDEMQAAVALKNLMKQRGEELKMMKKSYIKMA